MPEPHYYKTEFRVGTESYFEDFDSDDPALLDRYPTYDTDTHRCDRPPRRTQQRHVRFKQNVSRKQTEH